MATSAACMVAILAIAACGGDEEGGGSGGGSTGSGQGGASASASTAASTSAQTSGQATVAASTAASSTGSGSTALCEEAAAKVADCDFGEGGGPHQQSFGDFEACTPKDVCLAGCALPYTCEELELGNVKYLDCIYCCTNPC